MKGDNYYQNPENACRQPVYPFLEILKDISLTEKSQKQTKPNLMHSNSINQHLLSNHTFLQQAQQSNTRQLPRTFSLKMMEPQTQLNQMNKSHMFIDNKPSKPKVPPLNFTRKDNFTKGSIKINSARQMGSYKFQLNNNAWEDDNKSQKQALSPSFSPTLPPKGSIQWSIKKKKSKKSDDLGSVKKQFNGEKVFQVIPVENGKSINIVNNQDIRNRRGSNYQFNKINKIPTVPSPTASNPSPNSEASKTIKRNYSFTTLSKGTKKHQEFPSSGSAVHFFDKNIKYCQMPTEPDTPSAQRKINFREAVIQDFCIGKSLGKGRFGNVHIVKHKQIGFVCAMKVLSKKNILQQDFVNQFCREVAIQMYLKHRNIASLYGVFDDKQNVYLLMQLCLGGQLYKYMKINKPTPEAQAVNIIQQICDGVEYLHSENIIHRDLKPQNIIMHQNLVKICDFGWAVYSKDQLRDTFCGTPLFLAPEMLKGQNYSQKIDNWAIGMISYQMLMGRPPFKIKTQQQLQKIVTQQIEFPKSYFISPLAEDFISKLLDKDEDKRMQIEEAIHHPFLTDTQRF